MRKSTNGKKCVLALLLATGAVAQKPLTPGINSGTAVVTPQATLGQQVRVATGRLSGRALTTAGRQPIGFHTMTLCDRKGTEVDKLVTDGNGVYRSRPLDPGDYSLYVRKDLKLDLVVADDAETHVLDIVVPPRGAAGPTAAADPAKLPAAPGGAGPAIPGSVAAAAAPPPNPAVGLGLGTWALIGAGAATVVAVPVVASGGGGGSEGVVSSTGAHLRR